jgi:hypothetical protein
MTKTNGQRESETNIGPSNLLEAIQRLEREKTTLRRELWKYKRKPTGKVGYMLLFFGALILVLSMVYSSNVSAFVGISLVFWGALFLFISPTKYIKRSLLEPTSTSTFTNINKILANLNYNGKGVYFPPKYNKEREGETVFIPTKTDNDSIPLVKEVAQNKLFIENPKGICLTPSGLELTNLFEEELGIDFQQSNIEYLKDDLQKLFVEGLEIADSFEMEKQGNNVHVIISNSIYNDFCRKFRKLTMDFCETYSCPLCSSIACALTRVTGQPVTIKSTSVSSDNVTIHVYYQILGPKKQETIISKQHILPDFKTPQRLITLIPATLGSIILAWIGWLIWYDTTVWNKNILAILFSSRTGEAMSLGIGMRGIHYFIIGLAFFIPYIFILLKKRLIQIED